MKVIIFLLTVIPAIILAFALALPAFAAEPQDMTGASVIVRSVLDKNLLTTRDQHVASDLTRALEGSSDDTSSDKISSYVCAPSMGSTYCDIGINGSVNRGKGYEPGPSFKLHVQVYQGELIAASVVDFAR